MAGGFDYTRQHDDIKKQTVQTLRSLFPITGQRQKLVLNDVWIDDALTWNDFKGQASHKSKDKTWGVPVYASFNLLDTKTNEIIDTTKKIKLFNMPKITSRGTFIVKGNEYQVTNQLRLKSGAYTIRQQNNQIKTSFNLEVELNLFLSLC